MSQTHSPIFNRPKDLISVKEGREFQEFSTDVLHRPRTDVLCLIFGVAFNLVVMIVAFAFFNRQHYIQANFPTDSEGKLCGIDYPGYPWIYFTRSNQITSRLCVKRCPLPTDSKLQCKVTEDRGCNFNAAPGYEVENYETQTWSDRNGYFCIPTNADARWQIFEKSKLKTRNIFFNSKDSYIYCSLISIAIALAYFILVQFRPKVVNAYIIYVGAATLFILMVCVWSYPTEYTRSKILVGLVFTGALIILALTVYLFREAVKANGVFLHQATKLIEEVPIVLINVPFFISILGLFEYIMVLELNSIETHAELDFNPTKSLYWQYQSHAAFLKLLWVIQFIWGLNFFKESFNFVVSTYAVQWCNRKLTKDLTLSQKFYQIYFPYQLLITKHLGSVIACALMSAFFNIFDTIFDLARGKGVKKVNVVFENLDCFFDLVRSEAMPYISITGNSYCNAARYCEYLCEQSLVLQHSQSASRAYRFASYSTLAGFASILGLYINGRISILVGGLIMALSYFIVNFFVQMHVDTADGILIVFLQHEQMTCRNVLEGKNSSDRSYFNRTEMKRINHEKAKEIVKELEEDKLFLDQKQVKA